MKALTLAVLCVGLFAGGCNASTSVPIIPNLTCDVNTIDYDGSVHHSTINTHANTFSDFSIQNGEWNFVQLDSKGWPVLSIYIPVGHLEGNAYTRDHDGEILGTGKVLCEFN